MQASIVKIILLSKHQLKKQQLIFGEWFGRLALLLFNNLIHYIFNSQKDDESFEWIVWSKIDFEIIRIISGINISLVKEVNISSVHTSLS